MSEKILAIPFVVPHIAGMEISEVHHRSFRLPRRDIEAWEAAAAKLRVSRSEFLRRSLHEKAEEVLASGGVQPTKDVPGQAR